MSQPIWLKLASWSMSKLVSSNVGVPPDAPTMASPHTNLFRLYGVAVDGSSTWKKMSIIV